MFLLCACCPLSHDNVDLFWTHQSSAIYGCDSHPKQEIIHWLLLGGVLLYHVGDVGLVVPKGKFTKSRCAIDKAAILRNQYVSS